MSRGNLTSAVKLAGSASMIAPNRQGHSDRELHGRSARRTGSRTLTSSSAAAGARLPGGKNSFSADSKPFTS